MTLLPPKSWLYFLLFQLLLIALVGAVLFIHKEHVVVIKKPPTSLAQWYKPENERQVWLHNMFKLRREMQAVRLYSDNADSRLLNKWVTRLSEHYLKIGEMVPEWSGKLDRKAIFLLKKSSENNRYQDVSQALNDLRESCNSCHADYRAVTAAIYRAPDFSSLEIGPSRSYDTHMEELAKQVNRIKIASEDGRKDIALSSLEELNKGINTLGGTCSDCHHKEKRIYPDDDITKTVASLEQSLQSGTLKQQGQALGTLAVLACARCHGTHRIAYDIRQLLSDEQRWLELARH